MLTGSEYFCLPSFFHAYLFIYFTSPMKDLACSTSKLIFYYYVNFSSQNINFADYILMCKFISTYTHIHSSLMAVSWCCHTHMPSGSQEEAPDHCIQEGNHFRIRMFIYIKIYIYIQYIQEMDVSQWQSSMKTCGLCCLTKRHLPATKWWCPVIKWWPK